MGEDIAEMGGSMGVTQGMLEFGPERVRNTPISEMAIVGAGVGAAVAGMRPIVEVMYQDFLTLAMEQLVSQAAKHRYMSGGQIKVPLTVRTQGGAGWSPGAQHAQQLELVRARPRPEGCVRVDAGRRARSPMDYRSTRTTPSSSSSTARCTGSRATCRTRSRASSSARRACIVEDDVTVVATGRLVHEALGAAKEAEEEGSRSRSSIRGPCSRSTRRRSSSRCRRRTAASSRTRRSSAWASGQRWRRSCRSGLSTTSTRRCSASARSSRRSLRSVMEQFVVPHQRTCSPRSSAPWSAPDVEPGHASASRPGHGSPARSSSGSSPRVRKVEERAAVRARHREGHAGGRGGRRRRRAQDPRAGRAGDRGLARPSPSSARRARRSRSPSRTRSRRRSRPPPRPRSRPRSQRRSRRKRASRRRRGRTSVNAGGRQVPRPEGTATARWRGDRRRRACEGLAARAPDRQGAGHRPQGVARDRPEGRIVAEDVERAGTAPAPAAAAAGAPTEVEVVELTRMRQTIARRLTEAWQAPHFQIAMSADMRSHPPARDPRRPHEGRRRQADLLRHPHEGVRARPHAPPCDQRTSRTARFTSSRRRTSGSPLPFRTG